MKKESIRGLLVFAFMIMFAAACGCGNRSSGGIAANSGVSTGRVSGYVYTQVKTTARLVTSTAPANHMPLRGATITCAGVSGTTNTNGRFRLVNVPVTSQACTVAKAGYTTANFTVNVPLNGEVVVNPSGSDGISVVPATDGAVTITSIPAGGVILIDGIPAAVTTDTTLDQVVPGSHEFNVETEGYESSATQTITVVAGATATIAFTLNKLVTSIAISPSSAALDIGDTQQFAAACTYHDSSTADCTADVTWTSSDPTAATITTGGLLTAVAQGSTLVGATRGASNVSASNVTVTVGGNLSEPSCAGASGTCLDIVGTSAAAGAAVSLDVTITNPPADGLGAAEIAITWNTSELAFVSATPASGITVQAETTEASGQYRFVFTADSSITADATLTTLNFTADASAQGQPPVQFETTQALTNLTENDLDIVLQSAITFVNAYVTIQ